MIFLLIISSLLLLHYFYFTFSIYLGIKRKKNSVEKNDYSFITIIVPFRNEEEVILQNVQSLKKIDYPKDYYEVIYIDDFSNDDSIEILKKVIPKENFSIISLNDDKTQSGHKKKAIELGLKIAKGEIVVASDADCTYSPKWLKTINNYFEEDTGFVAGPVDFENDGRFWSGIQQLEHASLIITGGGLMNIGNPIICSGANLAFRVNAFNDVNGYNGYENYSSGDDSFLMTKIFYDSNYKIKFCFTNNVMVKTRANKNIDEFFGQRKRWVGKAFFYKRKKILSHLILLFLFFVVLVLQLFIGILFDVVYLYSFVISFLLKMLFDFIVMNEGLKHIYERGLLKFFLAAEFLHVPYSIISVWLGAFSKKKWKGREVAR